MCAGNPKHHNTPYSRKTSTLSSQITAEETLSLLEGVRPPEATPVRSEGAAGASTPLLKSNTVHLTHQCETIEFTRLNGREYSGKLMEISWGRARKRKVDTSSNRGISFNAEINREKVIKRAKTKIRRKAMHNNLNYMLSGTTRTCIEDRDKFGEMVSEWERRVKAAIPGWECITVLEKQQRGAYHFHSGVHGWQKLDVIRGIWIDVCDEGGGTIHVKPPPGNSKGNAQWDIVRLAGYLCKYISKAVGDEHVFDKKTYWHTRGIDDPPVTSILVEVGTEDYWANYIVQFVAGRGKHTWTDFNGAIGRTANF